jgi:2'-hydroxyisoflavone reductase
MKILLLGGPKFLGRHLLQAALERGHSLTMFNRGQTNPDLFPQVDKLRGDRNGDLQALRGKSWDAVIDTCGYLPRLVRLSAELLQDSVGQYAFISSISVYASFKQAGMDENAPLGRLEDESLEEITGESYGPLKVLCEQVVEGAFPGRALQVRAGLIVGPYDPTDRFTYWPVRVAHGGEVLAPGEPATLVQYIDARDLAGWILRMLETGQAGAYNATGPETPLSMSEFLETCRNVSASAATFTWLPGDFLLEQKAAPWSELPLWIPESDPDAPGFSTVDCTKAIRNGLRFRPLEETVRATLDWAGTRPADWTWRAGLTPEREAELLQVWRQRQGL